MDDPQKNSSIESLTQQPLFIKGLYYSGPYPLMCFMFTEILDFLPQSIDQIFV